MNRSSAYMEWAKLHSQARFNLAGSGIMSVPAEQFPWPNERLDITAPGAYGYEPLKQCIAQHAGISADCVVTAAGTSMANHLAMAALLEPGDEILLEQPTYGLLLDLANYLGARIKRFERKHETHFTVDADEVVSAITPATKLIVLTNLHNPSGAPISAETLRVIGERALHNGAHVLVDEVYLEMLEGGSVLRAFRVGRDLAPLKRNPFLITNSLTKAYGLSGLRCGWILAAPELALRISRLNDLFGVNAAHPADQLSVLAFDHLEKFRDRTQRLLSVNRPLVDVFLNSRSDLECVRPPGGTVFFPRLLAGATQDFVKLLRKKYETSMAPGEFFEMPKHFRIGIGGETSELRDGLERLAAALDEFSL